MAPKAKKLEDYDGPFNEKIAERMRQLGMEKLEEFADQFNIGRTTVYNLVLGRVSSHGGMAKPSVDTLIKLAKALETPLHVLVYELEPNAPGHEVLKDRPYRVEVPIVGWVGGGPEQYEEVTDRAVSVEPSFAAGRQLRSFYVRGDSMAAGKHPIYDGDVIVVDCNDQGYNAASVVARLHNDGYVCKMLKDDKFGRILQSRNPEHTNGSPTVISKDDVAEIVGRVVRIIHDDTNPA